MIPVALKGDEPSRSLSIGLWNEGQQIRAQVRWQRNAIAKETVQRAMGRLVQILQTACEEPGTRLRDL